MLSAMRVKSPFSQSALFGFIGAFLSFFHSQPLARATAFIDHRTDG
jgi:hypothetical protein